MEVFKVVLLLVVFNIASLLHDRTAILSCSKRVLIGDLKICNSYLVDAEDRPSDLQGRELNYRGILLA